MRPTDSAGWKGGGRGLAAGELAYALLAVCELGLSARVRGVCLGALLRARIRLEIAGAGRYARSSPGSNAIHVRDLPPAPGRVRSAAAARALAHARSGHDAGCHGFGVALAELRQLAEAWGRAGDIEYVLDAFRAGADLLLSEPSWAIETATETLTHCVGSRITARAPSAQSVLGLRTRSHRR